MAVSAAGNVPYNPEAAKPGWAPFWHFQAILNSGQVTGPTTATDLKALAPWVLAPWPLAPRSLVKVLCSYSRNRSSNPPTLRPLTAWWARSRWRRSLTRWRARSRSSGRFRVARSPGRVARSRCWPRPRRGRNSGMGFPRHRKLETWLKKQKLPVLLFRQHIY